MHELDPQEIVEGVELDYCREVGEDFVMARYIHD
jgi:hypothetical protein